MTIGADGLAYTPLDMNARGLTQIARASVSDLSTEAEIQTLLERVRALLQ